MALDLGQLLIELGIDDSEYWRSLESIKRKTEQSAKDIERSLSGLNLGINTKSLNELAKLSKPIKLNIDIDTRSIDRAQRKLDKLRRSAQTPIKFRFGNGNEPPMASPAPVRPRGPGPSGGGGGAAAGASESTLVKILDKVTLLTRSVDRIAVSSKASEPSATKSIQGVAGNAIGSIFSGLSRGITEEITKPVGIGLSKGLNDAVSSVFGSTELFSRNLSKSLAEELQSVFVSFANDIKVPDELKNQFSVAGKIIQEVIDEIVPETDRLTVSLAAQKKKKSDIEKLKPAATDQAFANRRDGIREYVLIKEEAAGTEVAEEKLIALIEKSDKYVSRLESIRKIAIQEATDEATKVAEALASRSPKTPDVLENESRAEAGRRDRRTEASANKDAVLAQSNANLAAVAAASKEAKDLAARNTQIALAAEKTLSVEKTESAKAAAKIAKEAAIASIVEAEKASAALADKLKTENIKTAKEIAQISINAAKIADDESKAAAIEAAKDGSKASTEAAEDAAKVAAAEALKTAKEAAADSAKFAKIAVAESIRAEKEAAKILNSESIQAAKDAAIAAKNISDETAKDAIAKANEAKALVRNNASAEPRDSPSIVNLNKIEKELDEAYIAISELSQDLETVQKSRQELGKEKDRLKKIGESSLATFTKLTEDNQGLPEAYLKIIEELSPGLERDRVPELLVVDNLLKQQGAKGAYSSTSNTVRITSAMLEALEANELTTEQLNTIYHELRHAAQAGFGTTQGAIDDSRGISAVPFVNPTPEELLNSAQLVSRYAPESRPVELDAIVSGSRRAKAANDRKAIAQQRENLTDIVGYSGVEFTKTISSSLDKSLEDVTSLKGLVAASGIDLSDELEELSIALSLFSNDFKSILGDLPKIETLGTDELSLLAERVSEQLSDLGELQEVIARTNKLAATKFKQKQADDLAAKIEAERPRTPKEKLAIAANKVGQVAANVAGGANTVAGQAGSTLRSIIDTSKAGIDRAQADIALTHQMAYLLGQEYEQAAQTIAYIGNTAPAKALIGAMGSATKALGAAAQGGYNIAAAFEGVALDALPFGRSAKGVLQQTALPAATFGAAATLLPGGEAAAGYLLDSASSLAGPIGSALGTSTSATAVELVNAVVPNVLGLQGAIAGAVSGLIEGAASGAAATVAQGGAAIVGGKVLQKAIASAVPEPLRIDTEQKALRPARKSKALPPSSDKIKSEVKQLLPAVDAIESVIADSIEDIGESLDIKEVESSLSASFENFVKSADPSDAIEKGLETVDAITLAFQKNYARTKEAQQSSSEKVAKTIRKDFDALTQQALDDINAIVDSLKDSGADVSFSSTTGAKLNNAKSQIARKRNEIRKQIKKLSDQSDPGSRNLLDDGDDDLDKLSFELLDFGRSRRSRKGKKGISDEELKKLRELDQVLSDAEAASDSFDAAFRRVDKTSGKAFDKATKSLDELLEGFNYGGSADGAESITAGLVKQLDGLLENLTAIGLVTIGVKIFSSISSGAIEAAAELERLNVRLENVLGSQSAASDAIQSLQSRSLSLGTNFGQDIQGFTSLQASARGTSLEGQEAALLADAVQSASAANQLTTEQSESTYRALSQIIDKSVVSMEEIRQQLGEALPGAAQISAKAMGLTVVEFNKLVESGELLSTEFLPKLARQLETESFLGAAASAQTFSAELNRAESQITILQQQVGQGLLPLKKLGLQAVNQALSFTVGTIGLVASAASALTATLGVALAVKVAFLVKSLGGLIPIVTAASQGLVGLAAALAPAAAILAGLAVAAGVAQVGLEIFGEASAETGKIAKQAAANLEAYQKQLATMRSNADEATKALTKTAEAQGLLGKISKVLSFGSDAENPFVRTITRLPFRGDAENIEDFAIERRRNAITDDTGQTIRESFRTRQQSENVIGSSELAQYKELEAQLKRVRTEQQAIAVVTPDNLEAIAELRAQERSLLDQQNKVSPSVNASTSSLDKNLKILEAQQNTLTAQFNQAAISVEEYNKRSSQVKREIQAATDAQKTFNKAIQSGLQTLQQIGREIAKISAKNIDQNTAIDINASIANRNVQSADLSPAQRNLQSQQISIAATEQKLKSNEDAIASIRAEVQRIEVAGTLDFLGVSENTGLAELARLKAEAGDSREIVTAIEFLEGLISLKQETEALTNESADQAAQLKDQLIDTSKAIASFFKQLEENSRVIEHEANQATLDRGLTIAVTGIQNAVRGLSDSFVSGLSDALIGVVEAFVAPLKNALDFDRQIQDATNQLLTSQAELEQLSEQLLAPGGGALLSGSSNAIAPTQSNQSTGFVGRIGSTGGSTGPHAHLQGYDGPPLDVAEINRRFRFGGSTISASDITDDQHDHANRGSRGIDVALPSGTEIQAVGVTNISDTRYDDRSGYYNVVTFEDGFEVLIAHQLPPRAGEGAARSIAPPTIQSPSVQLPPAQAGAPSGLRGGDELSAALADRFSPTIAAGFYGNIIQESGGDPGIENGIGAFGLVQWLGDRREQLEQFASDAGKAVTDVATQIAFIDRELRTTESHAYAKIQEAAQSGDVAATTVAIRQYYERPGEHEANDANRIANAREFAQRQQTAVVPAGRSPSSNLTAQGQADLLVENQRRINNLQTLAGTANVRAEEQLNAANQAFADVLERAGISIQERADGFERQLSDIDFDLLPEGPEKDYQRTLRTIEQSEADLRGNIELFIRQLVDTLVETKRLEGKIPQLVESGQLSAELAESMGVEVAEVIDQTNEALDDSAESLKRINDQVREQMIQATEERDRLESARLFENRQRTEGLEFQFGREVTARGLTQQGLGRDAINLEGGFQSQTIRTDFEGQIRDLEALKQANRISNEEFEETRTLLNEIAHANLQNVTRQTQDLVDAFNKLPTQKLAELTGSLTDAQINRGSIYGVGSYGLEEDIEKQQAIAQQAIQFQADLSQLRIDLEGIDTSELDKIEATLYRINDIKIDNIKAQFDEWTPAINLGRDATEGLFGDLLKGTATVGEAFTGFFTSIIDGFANIAAKGLADSIFGSILGTDGGQNSGGGFLGSAGRAIASIFNFSSGGKVPDAGHQFDSYRQGMGEISAALNREGHPGAVLAVLSPNEVVYTEQQHASAERLALEHGILAQYRNIQNFADGGRVGSARSLSQPVANTAGMNLGVSIGDVVINGDAGNGLDIEALRAAIVNDVRKSLPRAVEGEIIRQQGIGGRLN